MEQGKKSKEKVTYKDLDKKIFEYSDIRLEIHKPSNDKHIKIRISSDNMENIEEHHRYLTFILALELYMKQRVAESNNKTVIVERYTKTLERLTEEVKKWL